MKNKVMRNASWIISCRIIQAVLNLIISMLTARYLGPSNYGVISYAASVVAFVLPIMQLGLSNILVQEAVQNPEKDGAIFGTSIVMSLCSSAACIVGVWAFARIANVGETQIIVVCTLYSIVLFFQALELIQYWFQANYLSKYSSIVSLCAYVIVTSYKSFLLITGKNVYWFAVSNSLDALLIAAALLWLYHKLGGGKLCFEWSLVGKLFSRSRYYIVSSLMVTIFAQTDKIMLMLMLGEEFTGYYSAAITCAGMTGFVFAAIIDSARPTIFEMKKKTEASYERSVSALYSVIICASLLQSIAMTAFAKPIVLILYGKAYIPAVNALRIVVWYTTFSYSGSVRNIWILAEEKQKYLWMINLSGAIANIVLNAVMIPAWGINGAALASLITQIFTNVGTGLIIKPIRRNNYLMRKSLNPAMIKAFLHLGEDTL